MTDTDTTTDQPETTKDHRMLYQSGRLPMYLREIAVIAAREGLVSYDDLPWDMPQGYAFVAAVRKVLEDRGAVAAYLAEISGRAVAADCPFWCSGAHGDFFDGGESLQHEIDLGGVNFLDDEPETGHLRISVCASQTTTGTDEPQIYVNLGPESFSVGGARAVIAALSRAADELEAIQAATK